MVVLRVVLRTQPRSVPRPPGSRQSRAPGLVAAREVVFPLAEGAGEGEGERDAANQNGHRRQECVGLLQDVLIFGRAAAPKAFGAALRRFRPARKAAPAE